MSDLELARQHFMAALEKQKAGELAEAEALYRASAALAPGRVSVMTNLAAVLVERGRHEEARRWCEKVLACEPEHVDAALNLALCIAEAGDPQDALRRLGDIVASHPQHASARQNRALLAARLGNDDLAGRDYDTLLAALPEHAGALAGKGMLLLRRGQTREAIRALKRALRSDPHCAGAAGGMVLALRGEGLADADFDEEINAIALDLFRRGDQRPEALAHVLRGCALSQPALADAVRRAERAWPARLGEAELPAGDHPAWRNPALQALLATTPIASVALERLLVSVRRTLLRQSRAIANTGSAGTFPLPLQCALARQCFINEYIYPLSAEESAALPALRESIASAIATGRSVPAEQLAVLACYLPLHTLPGASRLLEMNGAADATIASLLTQQIREPLAEQALREQIERLTGIDDETSRAVRSQYEENPYPRWVAAARPAGALPLGAYLANCLGATAAAAPRTFPQRVSALTAGCGTGRQSIEVAAQIVDLDLLAIDLSRTSLAYAMRKAQEARITNIRFGQADILRLGELGRRFDFIDCTGVLHHLQEPAAGLQVLAGLLAEGGVMRLAFYSEAARKAVVAARTLIARRGIAADAEGIRRCREEIIALPDDAPEKPVARFADFFSTSECRDLLFHVQEHRYTLPQLADMLASSGLRFLGFELEASQLARFRAEHPDAGALADMHCWHAFEASHPDFFASMYQFWVCRS